MASEHPVGHPSIDWAKWEPAGKGDVRSPCPMINALANHGLLPHNGKDITKPMIIDIITKSINLSSEIATVFAAAALKANSEPGAESFNLDQLAKHGLIEHDVSLSRNDAAFGDNFSFDRSVWDGVMANYGEATETSFESASRARYERMVKAQKDHADAGKDFEYGVKEFVLSYGESALFLGILGDPKNGKIPLEYLRVLFQEERVPFREGWRPLEQPLTQNQMNHLIFSLVAANKHKAAEAADVGLGTFHAVTNAVTNLLPTHCGMM
ncbi:hypothetical protein BUE80_DR001409, partial [Diplocarpon rosae]